MSTNNAIIHAKNIINIDATVNCELAEIEEALAEAFRRYNAPQSWIITTADLLHKYEALSGKKYELTIPEDSIV